MRKASSYRLIRYSDGVHPSWGLKYRLNVDWSGKYIRSDISFRLMSVHLRYWRMKVIVTLSIHCNAPRPLLSFIIDEK